MIRTVTYQGLDYIVTHEFSQGHIWAYREVKHDIIDLYRECQGTVTVDRMLVPVLQQVFDTRERLRGAI